MTNFTKIVNSLSRLHVTYSAKIANRLPCLHNLKSAKIVKWLACWHDSKFAKIVGGAFSVSKVDIWSRYSALGGCPIKYRAETSV